MSQGLRRLGLRRWMSEGTTWWVLARSSKRYVITSSRRVVGARKDGGTDAFSVIVLAWSGKVSVGSRWSGRASRDRFELLWRYAVSLFLIFGVAMLRRCVLLSCHSPTACLAACLPACCTLLPRGMPPVCFSSAANGRDEYGAAKACG